MKTKVCQDLSKENLMKIRVKHRITGEFIKNEQISSTTEVVLTKEISDAAIFDSRNTVDKIALRLLVLNGNYELIPFDDSIYFS